jgi:RNA polymerase sigma-70 factor (ECF subfamily)
MLEETDLNLVKLARNGDRNAYRVLVERYQRKVYSVCYGMVRNPDDAMDMVQETFIRVFKNIERFEGSSSFYTWIYRIASNCCIDHIRKAQRAREVDYDDTIGRDESADGEEVTLPDRLGISPAHVLSRRELVTKIEDALQTLSPAHREAILLREVEGLSYQEIADALGISIGTVMSRLHHARKNMQKALRDYVGGDLEVDD